MSDSFVHLHQHTEYSMLDGAARVAQVVAKAAADGQPAMGITDHGVMYGIIEFFKQCQANGINPVAGTELYHVDDRNSRPARRGSKDDDEGGETADGGKMYYHLTALAESNEGYRNLIQLSSRAYLEGYYRKPRMDWDLLEQHASGLIATSGCLGGMVLQTLIPNAIKDPDRPDRSDPWDEQERFRKALEIAGRSQDILGRDNYFIELQDHGIPAQTWSNPRLLQLAKKLKAPLLATNDSHYCDQEDHAAHDALLCVQTGSKISDPNRLKFHGDQHYLKSAAEMRYLFREVPSACDNSLWIAERCNVQLADSSPKLPKFPLPEGHTEASGYLSELVLAGAKKRWGEPLGQVYTDRLNFELSVIDSMGFNDYFLIVWDLIRYAKECGARTGPGRGSAAGCAVAYVLGITDIDPIKYDLIFERFLNPSRISMPDIDMDIDTRFRDQWLRYSREMYGTDRVCQIVTFSEIKARAAVRDAARVLDHPYAVGDRIAKAVPPPIMGRSTPIAACLERDEKYTEGYASAGELREMYANDPMVREVVDVAKGLEGLRRQDGIHAAAVVISDRPLLDILPLQRKPEAGQAPEDAPVITQYEQGPVEDLGLLKMDFLGLRNLDVITDTVALVKKVHGVDVPIDDPPLDDPKTFAMLQRAETAGIFQLESSGVQDLIRRMKPTTFEDIGALVALYRPGPMGSNMHNDYADRKNGRKPATALHPDADAILGDTQNLMIYQEGMMRIAQRFAGYSLADADLLRKACGKKNRAIMAKERSKFVEGCVANGYDESVGTLWFDQIEPFADYSFNKSHAFGYAYVAYQTAYLKANWPHEYMAALLTSVADSMDKATGFLNECRRMRLSVLPPDVNRSVGPFNVARNDDGGLDILYGMASVRNVGAEIVSLVVAEREKNGPFTDFYDFCNRVPTQALNKKMMESLIKAGAFDSFGYQRKGLLTVSDPIVDNSISRRKKEDAGQYDLFSAMAADSPDDSKVDESRVVIPDMAWDRKIQLAFEKEMLGLYVSDHPLAGMEQRLKRYSDSTVAALADLNPGSKVKLAGMVTSVEWKYTKKGARFAVFVIEDMTGSIEAVAFSNTIENAPDPSVFAADRIVTISCRVDDRGEKRQIAVTEMSDLPGGDQKDLTVFIDCTMDELDGLKVPLRDTLTAYPGSARVEVRLTDGTRLYLGDDVRVAPEGGLVGELKMMFGDQHVAIS